MRKVLHLIIVLMLCAVAAHAQPTMVYDVETKAAAYEEITGGTAAGAVVAGIDFDKTVYGKDGLVTTKPAAVQGIPIGFDFTFNNKKMNQFLISGGGYIMLGKDAINVTEDADAFFKFTSTDETDILGVLSRGGFGGLENTEVSYKLTGDAPNRVLVVQYKNTGANMSAWDENFKAVQLQIRLHETTSKIDMVFKDWNPGDAEMSNVSLKIGIKATDTDRLTLSKSFAEPVPTCNDDPLIKWDNENYPVDGQTYTFTPPADCEAPAAQPTALVVNSGSISIEGSFTPSATADHYLTLLTDKPEITKLPEDGTFYAAGDSLDDALVVSYDTLTTFATPSNLSGATKYHVFVLSTNSACMYGPKYLASSPLTAEAYTKPVKPDTIVMAETGLTDAKINVKANVAGNKVMVAMTSEPLLNEWDDMVSGGTFGTPTGELSVGDEIEGGGRVIYIGEAKDGITIADLAENSPYHFQAWSVDEAFNYSSTFVAASTMTGGHVPYTPDFSKVCKYAAPAGWDTNGDAFELNSDPNNDVALIGRVSAATSEGTLCHIATPWIALKAGSSHRILMDVLFSRYAGRVNSPYNDWNDGDSLLIQVSPDGINYTTIAGYGKDNAPQTASLKSYTSIVMPFDQFAGQNVKMRIYWKTYTNPTVYIRNIKVEEIADCDYPVNLRTVDGSIVGDKATIDWDRQGNENEWELRYRVAGDTEWSDIQAVTTKPYTLGGLPGMSQIEVELRAKCDATTSSEWSKTYTFQSGYTIPLTDKFAYETQPAGWEPKVGALATPTVFNADATPSWEWSSSRFGSHFMFEPAEAAEYNEWLISPKFDMLDGSANYILSFGLVNTNAAADENATYSIVVSRDGGETFNENDVVAKFTNAEIPERGKQGELTATLRGYKGMVRAALYINATGAAPAKFQLMQFSVQPTCPTDISNIVTSDTTETSVKVAWETAADESYVFIRKTGDTAKPYVSTTEKTMTFTGLEPRTEYEIGITKVCEPGDSAKVTIAKVITLASDKCPSVTDVKVTTGKYDALIVWKGEASAYNVRYRNAADKEWATKQVTDTCIALKGLADYTEYAYAIQTMCSKLESDTSAYTATATFRTLKQTCFPPTEITAKAEWDSTVVTWTGEAAKYELAYAPKDAEQWTSVIVEGNKYVIRGLENETDYKLRMRSIAAEKDSSEWSDVVTFTVPVIPECVTPTDLTVGDITPTSVVLSWKADEANLRWNVHYRKSTDTSWTVEEGLTDTNYKLTELDNNASYLWSVMAECAAKDSKWATQNKFQTLVTGIDNANIGDVSVFVKNRILNIANPANGYIRGIMIYGADGKLMKNCTINGSENVFIPLSGVSGQVLMIKIMGKDNFRIMKIGL